MRVSVTEIVAELSGNHGGSLDNAIKLIHAAADAGADTVKFQCFMPARVAERRKNNPEVLALAEPYGIPLIDLYQKVWTPWEWFPTLINTARAAKIDWFSSVFDPADVAFLETLGCPRYKISAFELLEWDIIKAVRETGKPIVLSVRPRPGLTILHATHYDATVEPLGLSAHGPVLPVAEAPMVEYHLKLPGVSTPDDDFSLTPQELEDTVRKIRAL